jgi:hypothetical protein
VVVKPTNDEVVVHVSGFLLGFLIGTPFSLIGLRSSESVPSSQAYLQAFKELECMENATQEAIIYVLKYNLVFMARYVNL